MYEERKDSFNIKDALLQLLLVVLFVIIMIWLFPTKSYLKDNFVGKEEVKDVVKDQLTSVYGRLFADNIESMRDAAKGYYTNERLPKKIGDSVTLSLDDMYEKKLVLQFKDSNNESCSTTKSYVQVTKMHDEYQMKVQLSCSDYEDYIIVYMGCYDYCNSTICEKKETPISPVKPSKPAVKPVKPSKPTPQPVKPQPKPEPEKPDPKPEPIVKKYLYEYRKDTQNRYSDWGPWSDWSKNRPEVDRLTQVDYDFRKEIVGYRTEKYTVDQEVTKYREEKYKEKVGTKKVADGKQKIVKDATKHTSKGYYGDWVNQGYVTSTRPLQNSENTEYILTDQKTSIDCSNVCANVTTYTYKKRTRTWHNGKTTYTCPSGYDRDGSKCTKYVTKYKEVPVYETKTKKVPYKTTEKVEKTRKVPVEKNVTYYRYRKRTQIEYANTYIKWDESPSNQQLFDEGYQLTGNVKEV